MGLDQNIYLLGGNSDTQEPASNQCLVWMPSRPQDSGDCWYAVSLCLCGSFCARALPPGAGAVGRAICLLQVKLPAEHPGGTPASLHAVLTAGCSGRYLVSQF